MAARAMMLLKHVQKSGEPGIPTCDFQGQADVLQQLSAPSPFGSRSIIGVCRSALRVQYPLTALPRPALQQFL